MGQTQSGFQATGASPEQLKTSWAQQQSSLKQQQDFVNALNTQNGLSNQSNVFNQMQGTTGQLQDVANGTGPNPAMAALNQATGQNVANQAALMAGQRGAGANTGLIARQAAQQGGNLQQQAAGQGATMQAQQQLAGLNALQQQQAQMANLANTQVGQQQQGLSTYGQEASAQRGQLLGQQQSANQINAQMAQQNQGAKNQMIGNLMGAAGTGLGMMFGGPMGASIGGSMGSMFGGAKTQDMAAPTQASTNEFGTMLAAEGGQVPITQIGPRSAYGKHIAMAKGGKVPALVSPGEVYLKPNEVKEVAKGKKHPMSGEKIPGEAKVKGAKNDYANDTVHKTLDEGGIVLPRSVTKSKDADKKAIEFVQAILAKHHKGLK